MICRQVSLYFPNLLQFLKCPAAQSRAEMAIKKEGIYFIYGQIASALCGRRAKAESYHSVLYVL